MTTVSLSGLSFAPVEPSDEAAVRQWYELRCSVVSADLPADPPPCWVHELGGFRYQWPGAVETAWLVRDGGPRGGGGSVVGGCVLCLSELRVIDTCNADTNPYMVAINEAMGFRPHRRTAEWQLDLS